MGSVTTYGGAKEDCAFCQIDVLWESKTPILRWRSDVFVMEPLNPVVPGHVMVIPRVHVEDFVTSPVVTAQVMKAASDYAYDVGMTDVNLITSKGEHATQTVFHLHVHLVPRWVGDGLHLPWTGQEH